MGIGDFFNNAWDWASGAAKKVATSAKDAAEFVFSAVKNGGEKAITAAGNAAQTVSVSAPRVPPPVMATPKTLIPVPKLDQVKVQLAPAPKLAPASTEVASIGNLTSGVVQSTVKIASANPPGRSTMMLCRSRSRLCLM